MLTDRLKINIFKTAEACYEKLAADLLQALSQRLEETAERVSFAVSGGRTPKHLFPLLAAELLGDEAGWQRIDVALTDERWVDGKDPDSNEKLIRDYLLTNFAASAQVIGMKTDAPTAAEGAEECTLRYQALSQPLDVVYLGMGPDGHIASLFPGGHYDGETSALVVPAIAPAPMAVADRISLSLPVLSSARSVFLQLGGAAKVEMFTHACQDAGNARNSDDSLMPVGQLIRQCATKIQVYICTE